MGDPCSTPLSYFCIKTPLLSDQNLFHSSLKSLVDSFPSPPFSFLLIFKQLLSLSNVLMYTPA